MPFFLPRSLVALEYLGSSEEPRQEALGYDYERNLAFFAVNFGYSKAQYDALTPCECAFIVKAWETKTVQESTLLRNAVLNATANANRKKTQPFRHLWKKTATPADADAARAQLEFVRAHDKENGTGWIDKIRAAGGCFEGR